MRAIEAKMLKAIDDWRDGSHKFGNTEVTVGAGIAQVFLHGSHIATVYRNGGVMVHWTEWNTPTTRSRVSELLIRYTRSAGRVFTKNGRAHIGFIDGSKPSTLFAGTTYFLP